MLVKSYDIMCVVCVVPWWRTPFVGCGSVERDSSCGVGLVRAPPALVALPSGPRVLWGGVGRSSRAGRASGGRGASLPFGWSGCAWLRVGIWGSVWAPGGRDALSALATRRVAEVG